MNVKPPDTRARRRWLASVGVTTLAAGLAAAWWQRESATTSKPLDTPVGANRPDATAPLPADRLAAWVDTLLPADGAAPGALATGVAERIVVAAQANASYRELLVAGLAWANARAQRSGAASFEALPAAGRASVVAQAEAEPAGSTPRVFFQATLDDTHFHHWADPRSWAELGYPGPPQPAGFMDHAEPPGS